MSYVLRTNVELRCPLEDAWALFCDASNLEVITPPELRFRILTRLPIEMREGARISYRIRLFGVPFSWLTEITRWEPGVRFVDEQRMGPFESWIHEHRFEALDGSSTRIQDVVHYSLPYEPLGRLVHPAVRSNLDRIFAFRESSVRALLEPPALPATGTGTEARKDSGGSTDERAFA